MNKESKSRSARANAENAMLVCKGKFTFEREDESIRYGFKNLQVWDGAKHVHLHPQDEDKFMVTNEDYDTARHEFWDRWRIFCERKFKYPYVKIEHE